MPLVVKLTYKELPAGYVQWAAEVGGEKAEGVAKHRKRARKQAHRKAVALEKLTAATDAELMAAVVVAPMGGWVRV